jgi:hypothetical protein
VQACLQGSERKKKGEGERECVCVCMGVLNFIFYACKGAHTLFTDQREGERERGKRKGITGALAPFSYLVL